MSRSAARERNAARERTESPEVELKDPRAKNPYLARVRAAKRAPRSIVRERNPVVKRARNVRREIKNASRRPKSARRALSGTR